MKRIVMEGPLIRDTPGTTPLRAELLSRVNDELNPSRVSICLLTRKERRLLKPYQMHRVSDVTLRRIDCACDHVPYLHWHYRFLARCEPLRLLVFQPARLMLEAGCVLLLSKPNLPQLAVAVDEEEPRACQHVPHMPGSRSAEQRTNRWCPSRLGCHEPDS